MGLAGSDDFAIRVSAEGTSFTTGLSLATASGIATAPAGLRVAGGGQRVLLSTTGCQIWVPLTGTAVQQDAADVTAGRLMRTDYGYSRGNILGGVAQTAGVPTGAVIERGSNVNGDYLRLADGTQICWGSVTSSLSIVNGLAGGFRSSGVTPNFPSAFAAPPRVSASCGGLSAFGVLVNGVTLYGVTLCFTAITSQGTVADRTASYIAVGRWV